MAANVTKEQAIAELQRREQANKGFAGIGNDVLSSLESAPEAIGNLITSIPGGIKNVARYATSNNPVETLGNMGAGAVEGGAALLSSPQILMRYLADKFPEFGKRMEASNQGVGGSGRSFRDPTFYEALKKFETDHGLAPQSDQEASVRNAGGLIFGGGALTKLPNAASRVSTLAAQQAGAGGDPVHAAILGITGDMIASAPWKQAPKAALNVAKSIPDAVKGIPDAVKSIPEAAGTAVSSGLDAVAGLGSQARIPVVPSLMEALSDYIKYKSVKPETLAQRKLFSDINPEDVPQINERLEAAKRLGLSYLTPAEATLSPFEAAKQGTLGRTSSGSKLLFEKGRERTGTEGTAINNLLDTIYDAKDLDPKKAAAYEETMKAQVPDDFIERQTKRPVIEKAIKTLEGDAAYRQKIQDELGVQLGDVKPNSFMYWDMVKRVLGDMGESAKEQGRATTKSDILAETRRSMVDEMDAIKPEYEVARGIAERKFTRRKLEDVFDKKSMTINNFKAILGSDKKFNEIINKLKAYPEAQQKLKDMKMLFGQSGDMIHNDMNIRSAAALKRTSMSEARNKVDAMKQILDEKYGKAHDVAAVKLMTDPDWQKALSDYLAKKRK